MKRNQEMQFVIISVFVLWTTTKNRTLATYMLCKYLHN